MFATGTPFTFAGVPLDDCGDGFAWRCGDPTLRCWTETFWFEVFEHGSWSRLVPETVELAEATVRFGRCLSGLHVRGSGVALPTSLLAEGERWELDQHIAEGRTLAGPAVALGSAVARVFGAALESAVPVVMAVLPSRPSGAFVGFGEPERDGSGVRVIFDNRGVTYANG